MIDVTVHLAIICTPHADPYILLPIGLVEITSHLGHSSRPFIRCLIDHASNRYVRTEINTVGDYVNLPSYDNRSMLSHRLADVPGF